MTDECQGRQWDGPCGELTRLEQEVDRLRMVLGNANATIDADRRRMVTFIWAICAQNGGTFALTDEFQRAVPPDAEVSQFYDAKMQATVWGAIP